jgi:GT2 family glycosyltransferase/SAM-dependent methyltransferase
MTFPKVAALVLNWNLVEDTLRCVQSLLQSDYAKLDVMVVDNGSKSALYEELKARLPAGVQLLRSEDNLGFAAGNNLGLRAILAQDADYALVINNDTTVEPTMIGQLVAAAQANPAAGLVGPIIYYMAAPEQVWFAGYRFSHGIYILRRGLRLSAPLQPVEAVDFISGCSMLMSRALLEQVGLFATDYFMYYEDLDLCFRAKSAGFKILCVTSAKMWHAVSTSTGGVDSPIKQYYQVKSSLIFYRKHSRGLKRVLNITLRMGHAAVTLTSAVLRGRLRPGAIGMFLRGFQEGWHGQAAASKAEIVRMLPVERCPVCEAAERSLMFEGSDRLHDLPGRFPVVRCHTCQSAYLAQRPVDLGAYYPVESYAAYAEANTRRHFSRGFGRGYGLRQRQRLLAKLRPAGGTLLDVGCGAGDFLAEMQAGGQWQVVGLEPNAEAARVAREKRGLDVRVGQLPDATLSAQMFDVITLWHVLEHVPDPESVMAEVRRLLSPHGVVVVGVPLGDSIEARWFGSNWAGYDVPRHLMTFNRSSLARFGGRTGFQWEEQRGVVLSLSSLRISLGMWLNHRGGVWRRFQRFFSMVGLPPLYVLLRLYSGTRLSVGVFVGRDVRSG